MFEPNRQWSIKNKNRLAQIIYNGTWHGGGLFFMNLDGRPVNDLQKYGTSCNGCGKRSHWKRQCQQEFSKPAHQTKWKEIGNKGEDYYATQLKKQNVDYCWTNGSVQEQKICFLELYLPFDIITDCKVS